MDHDIPPIIAPAPAPAPEPPIYPVETPRPRGPWGTWATIGWTVLIFIGYQIAVGVVTVAGSLLQIFPGVEDFPSIEQMQSDGFILSLTMIFCTPFVVGLCLCFAWVRGGPSLKEYFGLIWPPWRTVVRWLMIVLVLIVVIDGLMTYVFDEPIPEFMVDMYRTALFLPLLWVAVIVGAPLVEEFMFRGFLLTGLVGRDSSRLSCWGAVLVSAGLWSAIHLQYDFFGMFMVFLLGILLGWARIQTGSLWLCILIHAVWNFVAMLQLAIVLD